ncbi:protein FAM136A-like [Macrosteles quadrilineatus]|uniref:protein FAM136A-like n=1 Tax=Macrosteles quadrilineatus TaxID=74068 RepID=UPI0023E0CC11|nr:protein FAM136A-like [Macrosteles quadrilineatus]
MSDIKKNEIEKALKSHIDKIDKLYLRKIQEKAFLCSAKCCSDLLNSSSEEVQDCVEKCNKTYFESVNYFNREIKNFHSRLQRCVNDCSDAANDKIGTTPKPEEMDKAIKMFEDCSTKCIDKHIAFLPEFLTKVHEVLGKTLKGVV